MEERRGPLSGQVTHVKCRTCEAHVLLDPAKMVLKATHAELRCPKCDALVMVRQTDVDKTLEGIWSIACYADDAEPEPAPAKHRFLRKAKAP